MERWCYSIQVLMNASVELLLAVPQGRWQALIVGSHHHASHGRRRDVALRMSMSKDGPSIYPDMLYRFK